MAVLRNKKGFTRKRDWVQWNIIIILSLYIIGLLIIRSGGSE